MQYLLDTHALIWWLANEPSLEPNAKAEIASPDNLIFVSAASTWEISIKKALGKLDSPEDIIEQITKNKFKPLPINFEETLIIETLLPHHQDPFDRILIAQARVFDLTIVTRDRKFSLYDINLLKC